MSITPLTAREADLLVALHKTIAYLQPRVGDKPLSRGYALLQELKGVSDVQTVQPTIRCCVCGTTRNLHKDGWYGYRCDKESCIVL